MKKKNKKDFKKIFNFEFPALNLNRISFRKVDVRIKSRKISKIKNRTTTSNFFIFIKF